MSNIPKWLYTKNIRRNDSHLELVKYFTIGFTLIAISLVSLGLYQLKIYADEIPSRVSIDQILNNKGENSKIFDRNGKLLYVFKDPIQDREYAEFAELPPTVIAAVLAAEDKDFFIHNGIDYLATAKGAFTTISSNGGQKVGGSTITQQLVKQTLLTSDRTLERKAKEAILTVMVEQRYSKEQILEFYLNTTSYGGRVIGIKTAAQTYFNKRLDKLSLNEAAFLVALIQSPGNYSPLFSTDKERARTLSDRRRKFVLDQIQTNSHLLNYLNTQDLATLNRINPENRVAGWNDTTKFTPFTVSELKQKQLKFRKFNDFIKAPHFVFYVRDTLSKKPYNMTLEDLYTGGYSIHTSLDLRVQNIAQRSIKQGVDIYGPGYGFQNGAMVVTDPRNGEILAMVGSKGYNIRSKRNNKKFDPKVNVTVSRQSLGSSLKPFVAYLGVNSGKYQKYSIILDRPKDFIAPEGVYSPKNSDGRFFGEMTLHEALLLSRNLPFLRISDDIGWWQLPQLMKEIGYRRNSSYGLAATIGGVDESLLDHVSAYSGLANNGNTTRKTSILRILDADGKVIHRAKKNRIIKRLNPGAVAVVNNILGDKSYLPDNYYLKFVGGYKLAGKTGTSDNNRDTYYIGYSPTLVAGVWVGNNDNTPMISTAFGSTTALPIWNIFMRNYTAKFPSNIPYGSY